MDKKNKNPLVRFKGFAEDWHLDRFENLTKINQGLQIAISNRYTKPVAGSYFYITNEFLKKGSKSEYYILAPSESVLCTENDVLMTRTGNTGEVVTNVSGAFHNNFFKIKFNPKQIDKDFLVYFLKLDSTQLLIRQLAGNSTIPDLNHNDFYRIQISFPKPSEQKQIGTFFQNLDNLITLHQKKYDKLVILKKAMLVKMFPKKGALVPEIRFKGCNGVWEVESLGKLAKITTGKSNREDSSLEGEYTFFDRSEEIRKSDIYLFDCEAIIIAGEGSDFIPKYFNGKFDLHQRTYAIINSKDIDGRFLQYQIHLFRKYFLDQAVGSTVKSLRLPMFLNMPIKFPSKTEQQKIGDYFKNLDNQIVMNKTQIDKLNNIKKACFSKMFVAQN